MNEPPQHLIVIVSNKCNSNCVICNMWKEERAELGFEELEKLFSDSMLKNLISVGFGGGETTLINNLDKIVELSLKKCNKVQDLFFNTNGLIPDVAVNCMKGVLDASEKFDRKIRINTEISLDSFSKNHDKIRGIKGAYEKTLETANRLMDLKQNYNSKNVSLNLALRMTVCSLNYNEPYEYFLKSNELGFIAAHMPYIFSDFVFQYKNSKEDISPKFNHEQAKVIANQFMKIYKETGRPYYKMASNVLQGQPRKLGCMFPRKVAVVTHRGDVSVCMFFNFIVGNIREKSFSEIWNSIDMNKIEKELKPYCEKCYGSCANDSLNFVGRIAKGLLKDFNYRDRLSPRTLNLLSKMVYKKNV